MFIVDLNISLLGSTDSSIILTSQGTGNDAIKLDTTGGVDIDAVGNIDILATNTSISDSTSVNIGNTAATVVNIGTRNSNDPIRSIFSKVIIHEIVEFFINCFSGKHKGPKFAPRSKWLII